MPFPRHQSGQPHAGRAGGDARHAHRLLSGGNPGAVHADVQLDHHPHLAAGGGGRLTDLPYAGLRIDGDHHVGAAAAQVREATRLGRSDHLVGDQDVLDAGGGHHLRLAQLGAGHAQRATRDQLVRQRRRLQSLGVRAPVDAGIVDHDAGDALDVAVQQVQVDEQGGRVELGDGQADRSGGIHVRQDLRTATW